LTECQRLLQEAKKCAAAMQAMAEVQGNPMLVRDARNLLDRDIKPLSMEVEKQLHDMGREELFYQAPDIEGGGTPSDMDALIHSSDSLLRESQSILAETEQIGTSTLQQMGRQREQLQNSNRHLDALRAATLQAKNILVSMSWRAWRSKFALYVMIAILSFANLYVLYKSFTKKKDKEDDSGNNDD
jgi:vesicle transport through interaction with t-SNAREs protein 1